MHGFCGIIGEGVKSIDKDAFLKSINLEDTMKIGSISSQNYFIAASFLESSPLKGMRIHETSDRIYLFAGDLIGYKELPWREIESNINNLRYSWFLKLRGVFAFVLYEKKSQQLILISDHRAQLPVYYGVIDGDIVFSTDMSTFTILKSLPAFNEKWLYEYIFINYPVDRTTFLKGVRRIRPFTILKMDYKTSEIKESKYGNYFKKSENIITGKEAIAVTISAFKERIPKYYSKEKITLAAISGGFDSRTLLSLAPKEAKIETYTYGVEGSSDLKSVSTFITKLESKHIEILFNNKFERLLPTLIYDTVRLSGGTQPILRSTLLYVYKTLYRTTNNLEVEAVLGGINGDFFRGWDFPEETSILSEGMKKYFKDGKITIEKKLYLKMFNDNFEDFESHIKFVLSEMKKKFGVNTPESRMNYNIYYNASSYFGGEHSLASNYFNFRQPYWDYDLLTLAYKTECSHIGYYRRIKERKDVKYTQYTLQSRVISGNNNLKDTYIKGLPVRLLATGNVSKIKIGRLLIRGFAFLKGYRKTNNKLEEWEKWFKFDLKKEIDKILNEKSLILEYINIDFINHVKNKNDIHLISKFVTTEIILNLIRKRWGIESSTKSRK